MTLRSQLQIELETAGVQAIICQMLKDQLSAGASKLIDQLETFLPSDLCKNLFYDLKELKSTSVRTTYDRIKMELHSFDGNTDNSSRRWSGAA